MTIGDYIRRIKRSIGTVTPHCPSCGSAYRSLCWFSYQPNVQTYRCMKCGHMGPSGDWEDQ